MLLLLLFFQEKEAENYHLFTLSCGTTATHYCQKETKSETDKGVRRQKVGEQQKSREGVVDKQEKN